MEDDKQGGIQPGRTLDRGRKSDAYHFLPGTPIPFGDESSRLPHDSRLTFRPNYIIVMNFQTGNRPMVYFDAVERLNTIGLPKELKGFRPPNSRAGSG
jgi:hypothetical protein